MLLLLLLWRPSSGLEQKHLSQKAQGPLRESCVTSKQQKSHFHWILDLHPFRCSFFYYYYSLCKYWLFDYLLFISIWNFEFSIVAFYTDDFISEPLFCFSCAGSLELTFIPVHKARFVFVLYPSVNIIIIITIIIIIVIRVFIYIF